MRKTAAISLSLKVIEFESSRIRKAEDIDAAAAAVIEAAAHAKLSLAEARDFMHLLELQRAAVETADLAVPSELLEDSERQRRRHLGGRMRT